MTEEELEMFVISFLDRQPEEDNKLYKAELEESLQL